jgi:hypothetical protein
MRPTIAVGTVAVVAACGDPYWPAQLAIAAAIGLKVVITLD